MPLYPWPYVDGLAIDEAANELAFITTGMYGKPLPPQNGGPIRMTTPWKYGFKQVKSIVKVTFTDKRPRCFWQEINASEYGFWANVNPDVSHPRWSQAREHEPAPGSDRDRVQRELAPVPAQLGQERRGAQRAVEPVGPAVVRTADRPVHAAAGLRAGRGLGRRFFRRLG